MGSYYYYYFLVWRPYEALDLYPSQNTHMHIQRKKERERSRIDRLAHEHSSRLPKTINE